MTNGFRVIKTEGKYRVVYTVGHRWEWRYELQERYFYYDKGEFVEAWHMKCCSSNEIHCIKFMENYINNPPVKKNILTLEEAFGLWR